MTEKKIEPKTPEDKKFVRMTPKEWAKAEVLWRSGEMTAEQIGAKFGKEATTIKKHFAKRGVRYGSNAEEIRKKAQEENTAAALEEVSLVTQRIRETKEEHYKMSSAIAKLTWTEVLQARQNKTPYAAIIGNLKALETAANVLAKTRAERYAVLGLDKDDNQDADLLPTLLVQELTEEQVESLRNMQDKEEFDMSIEEISEEGSDEDEDDTTDPDDDEDMSGEEE